MKTFRLVITLLFIQTLFGIYALAQVPTAPIKIGLIDTDAFYDDKAGITRLVTATKQINAEFDAQIKALEASGTRIQGIAKELETMRGLPQPQFNQVAYNSKQEEGERLQREFTYKKTELENAINKRREQLIGPISQDIGKGIDEYATKNGYGVILDVGKLYDQGALLYLAKAANVTADFVTFYNARPVPAATPAKP